MFLTPMLFKITSSASNLKSVYDNAYMQKQYL